ncbi:4-demethylwyosine synthase TYW1 [archaeon]|nr:4-demethylwyosine synthase TYW1 [archaeon]
MIDAAVRKKLENQGYRFAGEHSAIKVCLWTKKALRGEDICYKQKFYGISSHRCMQASVSVFNCLQRCEFCWRDLEHTIPEIVKEPDEPEFILDRMIKEHCLYIQGFKPKADKRIFKEALNPKHVALSLSGDASLYPKLPDFISLIKKKGMSCFLVSNGQRPDMLEEIYAQPTQTYITVAAPNKEVYSKVCKPYLKDGWEKLLSSLGILMKFKRPTIRLSLAKGYNMSNPRDYANIINEFPARFVELKAVMPVGYAQYRMPYQSMPLHKEIREFALQICEKTGYKIIDEKENSRVVLLMKKDFDGRMLKINYLSNNRF